MQTSSAEIIVTTSIGANPATLQTLGVPATAVINISSAQLLALSTTPVTLVPAPGPGKFILPLSYVLRFKPGTIAYANTKGASYQIFWDFLGYCPVSVPSNTLVTPPLLSVAATAANLLMTSLNGTMVRTPIQTPTNLALQMENLALIFYNTSSVTGNAATTQIISGQPTLAVALPGAGYAVNDVFTITTNQGQVTRYTVNSVNAAGGVLTFSQILNAANSQTNGTFYARNYIVTAAATGVGVGLYVQASSPVGGANGIFASTIGNSGGTGYAINDTGTIAQNSGGGVAAKYQVLSLGASNSVATYSITFVGQGFIVANNLATSHTTGAGTGFTINVTALGGGYAVGDTGTWGNGTYIVNSVDANGNVLSYTITAAPTNAGVNSLGATVDAGAQPGIGAGLTFFVPQGAVATDVTLGNGTLDVILTYSILTI